ncbi:ribonucleoside-triphosphate reductase, adenosylcobalamin-dependent [Kitasatospora sp. NPDC004723]|uniref:ribonucleoside-triphosphate reductase, adenosylcobalamin-dependent n=1 Tax=Kitasatospora sp. NPDC004723 TaxID=3154288 RepID=UPI0033A7E945
MTFKTETAETVFRRTYSRELPDGTSETWPQTVKRVVDGNLALVAERYIEPGEREALTALLLDFKALPAGRHLRSSGVSDFALNNCWAAPWDTGDVARHFSFTMMRLAEGGGVGTNYSSRYLDGMPAVAVPTEVHIVCDPEHPDYGDLKKAGLLSDAYGHQSAGAFPVGDSREGWADALSDLIRTAHDPSTKHSARVYDVSRVRCKGAALKAFGGTASGPQPFAQMLRAIGRIIQDTPQGRRLSGIQCMEIDHEIAQCIVSGGVRRSARMSLMHWDDPEIHDFLACKKDLTRHWTTNISVEIDSRFVQGLDGTVNIFEHEERVKAREVYRALCEGMLRDGEPGFWNSSLSAAGEPDGVFTVNPCAEALLTPSEPCNLGSINLGEFVDVQAGVRWSELVEAHRLMTRYLIRATFAPVADEESQTAISRMRRIGLGHLGFADYLARLGVPYAAAAYNPNIVEDLEELAEVVDQAAAEYAHQLRIPVPVKKRVIAPTGTISKLAGSSGEAVHPIFGKHFIRRIRFSNVDPREAAQVEEYKAKGYRAEPCLYAANTTVVEIPTKDPLVAEVGEDIQDAGDLTIEDMLNVQRLYQQAWADQAVSYTVNINPDRYTVEDLMQALRGYLGTLKGATVFPEVSRDQAPYERISPMEYEAHAKRLGIEVEDTGYDEICASGACPL